MNKKNTGNEIKVVDFDQIEILTILGKDTNLEGELTFEKSLKVKGHFKGKITSSEGFLWIDKEAQIEADIDVSNARIGGTVKGNIDVDNKVELLTDAKLYGNIKTGRLKIADGVTFEGNCEMLKD